MATMRDIKGRIRSVTTTKKTTKAMNLVSSSKLARAKAKLTRGTPFFESMRRVISQVVNGSDAADGIDHAYFDQTRKIKTSLIIVIANDRGLCGGYNTNVCRLARNLADGLTSDVKFITIGNKARDFINIMHNQRARNRGAGGDAGDAGIIDHIGGISENPFYDDALELTDKIMPLYEDGLIDEVYVCYTEFVSAITYEPKYMRILPMSAEDFPQEPKQAGEYSYMMKFEPSPKQVLDFVVPKYLATVMLEALSTAAAAGQAATMTAMDSATENAENIIDSLTLMYNRARQAAITQEISEIVGGANALE